jgi:hypothetical protein
MSKMEDLPSITLRPQAKVLGLDLTIQLGQTTKEALDDFPGSMSSKIGGV